jgi:dihydrofolate reductase
MPWHIPEDLKHFKTLTLGKPVIMGRKTFESIGKPLPGRTNIVISRSPILVYKPPLMNMGPPAPIPRSSLEDALKVASEIAAKENNDEIMIIGGGQIYEQAMPLTNRLYLTVIHVAIEGDTYFPAIDPAQWTETSRDDRPAADGKPAFSFVTLDRSLIMKGKSPI